jgi:hypothetical protein
LREPLITSSRIRPDVVDVNVAVGMLNVGVLAKFVASARTSSFTRSLRATRLNSARSILNAPGLRKKSRPVLPSKLAVGIENLARSAELR